MQPTTTDWIIAIATSLTTLTVVLIFWQVKADHERSRRNQAIQVMQFWTDAMSKFSHEIYFAKTLVTHFSELDCKSLWSLQPFKVDVEHEALVRGCLHRRMPDYTPEIEGEKIKLTSEQLSIIRDLVGFLLNSLEVVFCAWHHNAADRDMLESEFAHLVTPKNGQFPLEGVRIASGAFPSLAAFVEYKRQQYNSNTGKRRIA